MSPRSPSTVRLGASRSTSRTTSWASPGEYPLRASSPTSRRACTARVEPAQRAQPARRPGPGRGLLAVAVDLAERGVDGVVGDTAAAQLDRDGPAGQPALVVLGERVARRPAPRRRSARPRRTGRAPGRPRRRARRACRARCAARRGCGRAGRACAGRRCERPTSGSPGGPSLRRPACRRATGPGGRCGRPFGSAHAAAAAAAQKSTGAGTTSIGAPSSTWAPMPSFSLIFFSISSARSGLSRRKLRTFSLP